MLYEPAHAVIFKSALVYLELLKSRLLFLKIANFQDSFETCKPSFISIFSICMTVPFELQNENNTTTKNAKCEKLALYLTICDSQNIFY